MTTDEPEDQAARGSSPAGAPSSPTEADPSGAATHDAPATKRFYGAVKVGERGQIVVPADARADFGITAGDRLLVFGDLESGLWIAPVSILQRTMEGTAAFYQMLAPTIEKDHDDD